MALKEESEVLNEMKEKDHDFINGEISLAVHRLKRLPQEKGLKRQEVVVFSANSVERVSLNLDTL